MLTNRGENPCAKPVEKEVSILDIREIYDHLQKYSEQNKYINPISTARPIDEKIMLATIRKRIVELTTSSTDITGLPAGTVSIISFILKNPTMAKYFDKWERVAMVETIFYTKHTSFRRDYTTVVTWLVDMKMLAPELMTYIITDWFDYYPLENAIDYEYERHKCHQLHRLSIERFPLMHKLMLLRRFNPTFSTGEIIRYHEEDKTNTDNLLPIFSVYCQSINPDLM